MKASRYPEAAFLAARTASTTHEVRNVLAIIKESAGLVQDMIELCSKNGTLDEEKVSRAVHRVDAQVERGADLLASLNRLSHSLDQDSATIDLQTEVEQVVFLSKRLAGKKRQAVAVQGKQVDAAITVQPLRLQMALFATMELSIEGFPAGTTITVAVGNSGETPTVEFLGGSEVGTNVALRPDGEALTHLGELVDSIGASFELTEAGFGISLSFRPE